MDAFNELSKEELLALREELNERLQDGQKPPSQQVSMVLPNGETVQGTQTEVQSKLNEYYANEKQQQSQQQQRQSSHQEDRPQFDQSTFYQRAEKDWDSGMKYYFETKYGYDPLALTPLLVAAVNKLQGQLSEQNFDRSISTIDGFYASEKNRKILADIVKEKNWEGTVDSYKDAYFLARGRGLLEEKPQQKFEFPTGTPQPNQRYSPQPGQDPDNGGFAPPRVGAGGFPEAEVNPSVDEFYERTREMSPDKIRGILEQMESNLPRM